MPRSVMAKPLSDGATKLLKGVSTATLTTQLFRRGFRNVFMQGVAPLGKIGSDNLVGPAFTLRNIPAREDIDVLDIFLDPENPQRKGVETCPPGHVLVQDCRGDRKAASCGSILTTRLKVRGAAGMVSDGPVRDSGVIAEIGFPVFCAGASVIVILSRTLGQMLTIEVCLLSRITSLFGFLLERSRNPQ